MKKLFQATITPWYTAVPLGKHTLQQKLCANAGVVGHKTNHSLRASSATAMYNAGIPEKLIQYKKELDIAHWTPMKDRTISSKKKLYPQLCLSHN